MKCTNTFSLDSFKDAIKTNEGLKNSLTNTEDIVCEDEGLMTIHRENLMKYLEKYICKNEDDLSDTLFYQYGIFLKIVD